MRRPHIKAEKYMRAERVVPLRLRQARLRVGISQEKLGIAAGISEATASSRMNQYERGIHLPRPVTVFQVARVLGVPLPYFYAADEELAEVIWLFGRLKDEDKRKALLALRQLSSEPYKEN